MSGETLYPIFFVRIKRQGAGIVRVVDDNSPVNVGEEVVRAKVLSFLFEEDEKKADTLKLTLDNFDLAYFDSPYVKPGDTLKAKWGYPGRMSGQIECIVTKMKSQGTVLQIEATGKEYLLNRTIRPRVWQHKKRSDVVREIAIEYGYTANAEIHDTEITFDRIPQAKLTDHQMIVEMAKREGFVFYIDANGLYFGPRKLGAAPVKTIRYYLGEGGDLLAYPTIESDLFARPGAVATKGRDPDKKKDFTATANNDTTKGRPTVASTVEVVDAKTGKTSHQTTVATETTVATTARTAADAQRQVNAIYSNAQLGAVKATLTLRGDPNYRAKTIVQLVDVGAQVVGKYYLTAATHTLSATSYTVSAKARREALNSAGTATKATSKGSPNKQAAPPAGSSAANGDKLAPHEVVDAKTGQTRVEYR